MSITAVCPSFARGFSPIVARGKTRAELLQCGNVWSGSRVRISPERATALPPGCSETGPKFNPLVQRHTNGKRIAAEVIAVQLDQVERPEEDALAMPPIPHSLKAGNAVVAAGDSLAVDDAGACAQAGESLDDPRKRAVRSFPGRL
jgi:hypothetical protein